MLSNYKGIVFLDIDGVLNDDKSLYEVAERQRDEKNTNWAASEDDEHFCKSCSEQIIPKFVKNLNRILVEFNLGIVLSSTWRRAELTRRAITYAGIDKYNERFLGITPLHRDFGGYRGAEIHDWIIKNDFTGPFVILDDDGDMNPYMDHLIQTNWFNGGLTDERTEKVFEYLNRIAPKHFS